MDNTGFEGGGEAVLLAARGLPNREARRTPPVALELGDPPQTNGGPPSCRCPPPHLDDVREKSPGQSDAPLPIVAQDSPWHKHKTVYLSVIVVTLALWVLVYTIISELHLA